MAPRGLHVAGILALGGFFVGCSPYGGGGAFACTTDTTCGTGGKCSDGFCSFPDPSCMSGYRYGEFSGTQSNVCVGDTNLVDSSVDVPVTPDGASCFGTGLVTACFAAPPTGSRTLTTAINTDDTGMCATIVGANASLYCVIAADKIVVQGVVTATGNRPLVLVATQTIEVQGSLDVASHRAGPIVGAGAVPAANTTLCHPAATPAASGGGAGGSFGATGGSGGNAGGAAGAIAAATELRGGCAGHDGTTGTFGVKGLGGGAVYLYAGTSITVSGSINASGAAGTHGTTGDAGGGGGGSGGMIAFDSPVVTNLGAIFANGGGGAEGSGNTTAGFDGNEPIGVGAAAAADGLSNGGGGGSGGAQGAAAGTGGDAATYGGGGGGGGVGVIKLFQATSIAGAGAESPNPS